MPEPFVMPERVTVPPFVARRAAARLGTRSVVRIALATDSKSPPKDATSEGIAVVSFEPSISTPITPVDAGSTWSTGMRSAFATALQVSSATLAPVRVAQFAFPAFTTMTLAFPRDAFKLAFDSRTGAA